MNYILYYLSIITVVSYLHAQELPLGLSYDDVLLVPAKSTVNSRKNACLTTHLTKKIALAIPIISANMDTVTESEMAIVMAQLGGIGIIHRFNTIEQQVCEVERVKRYRNVIIEHPLTIIHTAPLCTAQEIMKKHGVSGLLVIDENNKLVGILTSRDIIFCQDQTAPVSTLMTARDNLIVGTCGTSLDQAKDLLKTYRIEKLPIIYDNWTIAGLITRKDIFLKTEYPHATLDEKGRLRVGAAIGVQADMMERTKALIDAGADVLILDIAHGHSDLVITALKAIKEQFHDIEIIAGNVATADGVRDLICAGADGIKVGVGPGSICTTRIVTGCGVPQLSAVSACSQEAHKFGIPVIADGGIKYSGDITKALAAGASTVMLGNLLAGTDESPGMPFVKNGKKFKVIRGMASAGAYLGKQARYDQQESIGDFIPEGVEATVPYRGHVVEVVTQLIGGLRSGMSYCGCRTIEELWSRSMFIQISSAGSRESHAHDVTELIN